MIAHFLAFFPLLLKSEECASSKAMKLEKGLITNFTTTDDLLMFFDCFLSSVDEEIHDVRVLVIKCHGVIFSDEIC